MCMCERYGSIHVSEFTIYWQVITQGLIHLCEFTQDELKWRLIEKQKQTNKPTKTNINFKILEIVHNFPFHSHLPGLCIPVGISPLPLYANI